MSSLSRNALSIACGPMMRSGSLRSLDFELEHATAPTVRGIDDLDVVGQQRVQAIDRRELLGQTIVGATVIGLRAGNATERFAGADAADSIF